MREQERMTQTMNVTKARDQFSQVVNKVYRKEARVILEKSGIPVAAIVSADDLERLNRMEAQRAERFKIIDEMREAFKDVPEDEIDREVDKALTEVRAEDQARDVQPRTNP
jgi:prevent-host-death family protein